MKLPGCCELAVHGYASLVASASARHEASRGTGIDLRRCRRPHGGFIYMCVCYIRPHGGFIYMCVYIHAVCYEWSFSIHSSVTHTRSVMNGDVAHVVFA